MIVAASMPEENRYKKCDENNREIHRYTKNTLPGTIFGLTIDRSLLPFQILKDSTQNQTKKYYKSTLNIF